MAEEREGAKTQETKHPGVGWLELFFDLVFVATLSLINEDIRANFTWSGLLFALLAMAALFSVWIAVTLIMNRFPDEGEYRRTLVGVIMVTLLISGLGISKTVGIDVHLGQISFAITLVAVGALLVPVPKRFGAAATPIHLSIALLWGIAAFIALFAVLPFPEEVEFAIVAAGVLIVIISVTVIQEQGLRDTHAIRPGHLVERLGLLVIILLGEGLVVLTVALREPDAVTDLRFLLMTFVLAYLLWRYFFDSSYTTDDRQLRWGLAAFGIFVLIFGIVGMFDVFVDLAASAEMAETVRDKVAFALVSTLTFIGFAILSFARTGAFGRAFWSHVLLTAANLGLVAALIATNVGLALTAVGTSIIIGIDVITTSRRKRTLLRTELSRQEAD